MGDLPNEDRNNRYVALGPNQGDTLRGLTGFYTYADKLAYGVNVQGNRCGVYGESRASASSLRQVGELGVGVCGVGGTIGVKGEGDGPGGKGVGVDGFSSGDVGVHGRSYEGTGVHGESDTKEGVLGESLEGAGVRGVCREGAGVFGMVSSINKRIYSGRGGVFKSWHSAQVQLEPQKFPDTFLPSQDAPKPRTIPAGAASNNTLQLPEDGKGGDLLTLMDNQEQCALWFCVRGAERDSNDKLKLNPDGTLTRVAVWAQVLLGPSFEGTKKFDPKLPEP